MRQKVLTAFFAALVFLALAWMLYGMLGARRFVWQPTLDHESDEPFGCQLFDQMAEATLPNGYTYYSGDLDSLLRSGRRMSLLLVNFYHEWDADALARLDSCVRSGSKLMLVTTSSFLPYCEGFQAWKDLEESMRSYNSYFEKEDLAKCLKGKAPSDTLLCGDGTRIVVPPTLLSWRLDKSAPHFVFTCKLLPNSSGKPMKGDGAVSARAKWGRGELHIVTTPLLFTNYGVLDDQISKFLGYELAKIADKPVVRIDPSCMYSVRSVQQEDKTVSPLYFMLDHPPLRWALYTLVAAAVLLMFFTARRRQRVIPVVAAPVNRNLEFVRILGTIYFRNHDNHDLLCKKYTYFREELRRTLLIDIEDKRSEQSNVRNLSQRTGLPEETVSETLLLLRTLTAEGAQVSNQQLTEAVSKVDEIIKQL